MKAIELDGLELFIRDRVRSIPTTVRGYPEAQRVRFVSGVQGFDLCDFAETDEEVEFYRRMFAGAVVHAVVEYLKGRKETA